MTETTVSDSTAYGSETDRLDPLPEIVSLKSGTKVRILPLKMRQLFRLLRIVTRGGAAYLPMLRDAVMLASDENAGEVFGTQLLAIAVIALPEAEDEAVEFISSVADPADLPSGSDKQSRERAEEARRALAQELSNPDPEDLMTIVEVVISREKDDLVSLGKRLAAMLNIAAKTGQIDQQTTETMTSIAPILASSAASPEPATSSPASTAGPMTSFSTSPSAE